MKESYIYIHLLHGSDMQCPLKSYVVEVSMLRVKNTVQLLFNLIQLIIPPE